MASSSSAAIALSGATWIDINTSFTQNTLPDRLPDAYAVIYSSLVNLFNCQVGQRGRTFQPEYGSTWLKYLQEPIHELTARSMELGMFQAIQRWEPRITLKLSQTSITADYTIPGYKVRLAFSIQGSPDAIHKLQFDLSSL